MIVPDITEQGEWTAIKKINKSKKGANKKSGSRKDLEQPEERPVNPPVQEPVKEEPQPKVETIKKPEPVKEEKLEVKQNPVPTETKKTEVQNNLPPQTQEPEKKGKPKKKIIASWNVEPENETSTNVPEPKIENDADFPSLGETVKQPPKQEKKPSKEVSKTQDTQQAKSNKPGFYKVEESDEYPSLSQAAVKRNLPEKPKTNASSGVKPTNNQTNKIKQSTNKSGTWASQSVQDN